MRALTSTILALGLLLGPNLRVVRDAIEAARHVAGVRAVRNDIDLARTAGRTDPYGTFPYGYPEAAFPDVWPAAEGRATGGSR